MAKKIRNMDEFAAVSGTSRPTVSKYFNDPGSVRESTRAKIERALERYDFRPNVYAMNQNRKLTRIVGIVVPYLSDPFFSEISRNIEQRCIARGFQPALYSSYGDPAQEVEILDTLRSLKPAGVLIAPLGRLSDLAALERFCEDVPTVLFDSYLEGMGQGFVGSDNFSFVSQSVEYLTRTGTPPCFFEMKRPANPNARRRHAAYITMMDRLGFTPEVHQIEGDGWGFEQIGYDGAIRLLDAGDLGTNTVLCSNDRLAIGFLAAAYEKGLKVGRGADCDLRVAAHDDHPFSRFTCPALTTVAHDYDAVSNNSVETLFDVIEAGGSPAVRTEQLLPAKLVLRDSA